MKEDDDNTSENDQKKPEQVLSSIAAAGGAAVTPSEKKEHEPRTESKVSNPISSTGENFGKGKQYDAIKTPNINDILLGRGGHNNKYIGNERLRQIVADQVKCYATGTKLKKSKMVRAIVRHIRSLDPPGRFLRFTYGTKMYEDAGDKFATEKVSQVFRDAMAKQGLKNSGYVSKSNSSVKKVDSNEMTKQGLQNYGYVAKSISPVKKVDPIELLLSTAEAMEHSERRPLVRSKEADPSSQWPRHLQHVFMNGGPPHLKSIPQQLGFLKREKGL
jgi:hypothetical protein